MKTADRATKDNSLGLPPLKKHIDKSLMLVEFLALNKLMLDILQVHMSLLVNYLCVLIQLLFEKLS
jgi:hypothetical protein